MGNNCVGARKGGLFPYVSSPFWWSNPTTGMELSHVSNTSNPNAPEAVQQKPPQLVKIDNNDLKPVHQHNKQDKGTKPSEEEQIRHKEQTSPAELPMQKEQATPAPTTGTQRKVVIRPEEPAKPKMLLSTKRLATAGLQAESVLLRNTGHLKEYYNLGPELGHGQYGTTSLCVEKASGKKYACKSIAKVKLLTDDDVEDVRREIQIMHHLAGSHNVISIKGAYEDSIAVHVVMELCVGGELFDRIVERGHYTERKAAKLARTVVSVVEACHSLGVMHRDLKPENFLFVDGHEDSTLKAIDFGMSVFFKPGLSKKCPFSFPLSYYNIYL